MAGYGVLEEHTRLESDFSILAFAFCWACGLNSNEAWTNVKSLVLDIPMSLNLRASFASSSGDCPNGYVIFV